MNFTKIIKPIVVVFVLAFFIYIRFQKGIETTLIDYVINAAIVVILLVYAEEILLLLVFSPFVILEKSKKFMRNLGTSKFKK